ncbi:MAG: hypothetical protein WCJ56_15860, partial [bacterium]
GGKLPYYDLVVVVTEDESEAEMKQLIEEARGSLFPECAEVLVLAQPTRGDVDQMVKGNWSAIINLLLQSGNSEVAAAIRRVEAAQGSMVTILSAGTGKRNAPLTGTGWWDKGKQLAPNGEAFIHQIFRQIYHYWDPRLSGMIITTNDGIKALGQPVVFGEYGIEMIGAARLCEDAELDGLGTALVEHNVPTVAWPIRKMVEKAPYADWVDKTGTRQLGRQAIYGAGSKVATNWADYYLRWDAIGAVRQVYGVLRDDAGRYLHLRWGLDTAGDLFESVTTKTGDQYLAERSKKWGKPRAGETAEQVKGYIIAVRDAAKGLKDNAAFSPEQMSEEMRSFGYVDTGEAAIFVDTGSNEVYFNFCQDLTIRTADIGTRLRLQDLMVIDAAKAAWAKAARALLALPEPNDRGQLVYFRHEACVDGRRFTDSAQLSEAITEKLGKHVFLAGKFMVVKQLVGMGDLSVAVNPWAQEFQAEPDSFTFFVKDALSVRGYQRQLTCDLEAASGTVRVIVPLSLNANDPLCLWRFTNVAPQSPLARVGLYVTKGKVVAVEGAVASTYLGARVREYANAIGQPGLRLERKVNGDDEHVEIFGDVKLETQKDLWDVT